MDKPKPIDRCHNCKWWSDKITSFINNEYEAYCLNPKSPHFGSYTLGTITCNEQETGRPVDECNYNYDIGNMPENIR